MIHKINIKKWDFINIKNVCFAKDTLKRIKRQVEDWEKIFVKLVVSKGLYPKYTKSSSISTIRK